jgi:hypothetical protein
METTLVTLRETIDLLRTKYSLHDRGDTPETLAYQKLTWLYAKLLVEFGQQMKPPPPRGERGG